MRRKIAGIWYKSVDVGCSDFGAARKSRERQKDKHYLIWWYWYEAFIKSYPRNRLLPEWAIGKLPSVDKSERENIWRHGIYEIEDDGILKVNRVRGYWERGEIGREGKYEIRE